MEDDEVGGDDDEMRSTRGEEDDDEDAMEVDESATIQLFHRSEEPGKHRLAQPAPTLSLSRGFKWYGPSEPTEVEEDLSDSGAESDRDDQFHKKKRKKRKEIEEDLTAELHTKMPESNADFERILLG